MNLLDKIKEKSNVEFRPAAPGGVELLRSIGVPEDALAFYRDSEPTKCAEIDDIRLWPVADVLGENKDFVPGCFTQPHGYVVFATTIFGDAFCFDRNALASSETAPVVLIAHDWDWDAIKYADIVKLAKPTAPSFKDFLEAYASETLDILPNYPPFEIGNAGDTSHS
jgi:hypothetical protein